MDNNQLNNQNSNTQEIDTGTANTSNTVEQGPMQGPSYQGNTQGYQTYNNPYADNRTTYAQQQGNYNYANQNYGMGNMPQQQPYMNMQYSYQGVQPQSGNGMIGISITGMVCGIVSILICFTTFFNLIVAIPGLIFSIIALVKKYNGKSMAIAGLICSTLGILLSTFYFFFILIYIYV